MTPKQRSLSDIVTDLAAVHLSLMSNPPTGNLSAKYIDDDRYKYRARLLNELVQRVHNSTEVILTPEVIAESIVGRTLTFETRVNELESKVRALEKLAKRESKATKKSTTEIEQLFERYMNQGVVLGPSDATTVTRNKREQESTNEILNLIKEQKNAKKDS